MHAVSLTPHAEYDTAGKISHRLHNERKIRAALAAFKGNIYQKHLCT
jgi:tRNA U55 pseudouridine synthase TruB